MSKTIPSTEGEARRESKTNLDSRESRRTKTKSMKRAFCLFWHGLTALLAGIANLFAAMWVNMSNRQEPTHLNMLSSWDKIC